MLKKYTVLDAELAGHAHKLVDVMWECLFFICCAHARQALPLWTELNNNT